MGEMASVLPEYQFIWIFRSPIHLDVDNWINRMEEIVNVLGEYQSNGIFRLSIHI